MTNTTQITPFRVEIPQPQIDDLKERLARTRWPADVAEAGWNRGVPVAYAATLAEYWRNGFDWRAQEARLNEFPQFTTEIDGQRIHFLHVRSAEPGAHPLLLTHGWPGSVAEFLKIIDPLTDPKAHGGESRDAFDVVIPSIPGFGFSSPTRELGWDSRRIAAAWVELMRRLGYERYSVQGGDVGVAISREVCRLAQERVAGIHVNGGFTLPIGLDESTPDLTDRERARLEYLHSYDSAYALIQVSKPLTLAYGLTDSPAGQLAWIVEKFREWTDPAADLPEDAVDLDQLLTNVSIYWFTGTAVSSAQLYQESGQTWGRPPEPSPTPAGVALFTTRDVSIRRVDEQANNIVHWTDHDRGGHFAAMEAPDLFVDDLRAFFRTLR